MEVVVVRPGDGDLEPRQPIDQYLGSELLDLDAVGDMRRGRGKDVAPVKRGRHRTQHETAIAEQMRGLRSAALIDGRHDESVVWSDENLPVARLDRNRSSLRPNGRIDYREVNALGHELDGLLQHDRTVSNVLTQDVVVDVDDSEIGLDPQHHPVADTDELILQSVVGKERDDRSLGHRAMLPAVSWGPSRSRGLRFRGGMNQRSASTRSAQACRSLRWTWDEAFTG